ncbi:MAG: alpha/beta hydrolase [Rhodospirillaceae bacterium]|nr:alpha/beta hydrolase [Rhodospirillaceae bacterium]
MKTVLKIAAAALAVIVIALGGIVADASLRIATEEVLAPDDGAPGRFVTVDGHKLHVATIGDPASDASGAPLLLIHGFGIQGHAAWLPWASKLAGSRSLIMPDMLGFGHSARVTAPGPHYTAVQQAAALADMLDVLGVAQVDVVGHALGGAVAAQFAIDHPARVRRIVFMDAAVYSRPRHARAGIAAIDRILVWRSRTGGPLSAPAKFCGPQPNCRWLRLARVQGSTDALLAMDETARESKDSPLQVARIAAPSLVIWGGNDTTIPVADGDRLARELKTTLSVIADAGPAPYADQPDKVARRVLEFLQP